MSTTQTLTATNLALSDQTGTMSKRKKVISIVLAIAAVIAVYMLFEHFTYVTTDNAQIRANSVIIASKVNGAVTRVLVEENQKVKKGEVLAEVDSKDYSSRENRTVNEMESLSARYRDAERNFRRMDELFRAGAVSQQQRDTAQTNYNELSRKLKAAESDVDLTKSSMSDTQIRAPFDGVVAKRAAEVGMLASPGLPLFGIVSSESRWIVANFKETDLKDIHLGREVEVSVDAVSGRTFKGTVESLGPATGATFSLLPQDNATGNFTKVVQRVPIRIGLGNLTPEEMDLLRAGLSADVKVHIH